MQINRPVDEFAYTHEKNVIDALHYYASGGEENPFPPRTVWIETTTRCTLKCKFCAHQVMTRPHGAMDFATFTRIIDDLDGWLTRFGDKEMTEIALTRWGEPLLHPELGKMIAYLTAKGLYSYLPTNGTVLTPSRREMLFNSTLKKMNISIDVMDDDRHREIMGIPVKQRMLNILSLLQEKYVRGAVLPVIEASMVKLPDNADERALFRAFFRAVGIDRTNEGDCLSLMGTIGLEFDPALKNKPCFAPWFTLGIYWNGDCTSCLPDPNGDTFIGNCLTEGLENVWNGERVRAIRRAAWNFDYAAFPACANCNVNTYDRYQVKPFFEAYVNYQKRFATLDPQDIRREDYLYLTHLQSIASGGMNPRRTRECLAVLDEAMRRLRDGEAFIAIARDIAGRAGMSA